MILCNRLPNHRPRPESGHLIVGLVVLLTVMIILLTAAAQSWTFLIRRDREAELIFRGEQYAKAIAWYRQEANAYPLQLDLLMKKGPRGHRYIRKLYEDPLAEDGEWGLLYLSPTGKGYINPYATQIDPFLSDPRFGGQGLDGGDPLGPRAGLSGMRNRGRRGQDRLTAGYSEMTPDQFERLEGQNLPIVGVVHKKEEYGIKLYHNIATLNDWAFTMLAEGQEMNPGGAGGVKPARGPRRSMGIGDHTAPIFLPGMVEPGKEGPPGVGNLAAEEIRRRIEEQRRRQEEERRREEDPNYDGDPNTYDDDPNGYYDDDPNTYDEDPNG